MNVCKLHHRSQVKEVNFIKNLLGECKIISKERLQGFFDTFHLFPALIEIVLDFLLWINLQEYFILKEVLWIKEYFILK